MKKKLVIVGGRGSGEIAMSVFQEANRATGEWEIAGFLSDAVEPGGFLGEFKVLGPSAAVGDFVGNGFHIHYALHFHARHKEERVKKMLSYNIPLEAHASAVHPRAFVDPSAKVGCGTLIGALVGTSPGPTIGNFVHIYTGAFIAHDSLVDHYVTIAANAAVGARVRIREGAHIGLNATVREEVTVGRYAIVGIGAVVVDDVPDFAVAVGNPARIIKYLH